MRHVGEFVDVGERTSGIILRRVALFLAVLVFLNTLDRVNLSFAALKMNHDLGLSPQEYGFGVGLFFVSYMLFQIPAMAFAERIGLVRAIGCMAIGWGAVSMAMCSIGGKTDFYLLRLLLGIAEAGASPVILLYASRWAPPVITARFIGWTALALPACFIVGAPVSGWLMTTLDGVGGMAGWRWMYFCEGALPIVLGVIAFFWLSETPRDAKWLDETQRAWLVDAIAKEASAGDDGARKLSWQRRLMIVLADRRVWSLGFVIFCTSMGLYGFLYWLPQLVAVLNPQASTFFVLVISTIPWISVGLGMIVVGRHSDRTQERHLHVGLSALLAAIGLAGAALLGNPFLAFASLVVASIGVGAAQGVFYSIPFSELRGTPQIGMALAVISVLGNAAGFVSGNAIGVLREITGSFNASIALLSLTYLMGAAVVISQRSRR